MTLYRIEKPPLSLNSLNPRRNRQIAAKAADGVRSFRFATISEAVDEYLSELTGPMGRNYNPADRRKDLAKYVYEDLKAGPKSLHVFSAISEFSKRRNRQIKERRKAELINRLMSKPFPPSV